MNDFQMRSLADQHTNVLMAEAERGRRAHSEPTADTHSRRRISRVRRSHLALLFGRVAIR